MTIANILYRYSNFQISPISNRFLKTSSINIYIIREITVAAIDIMCNLFSSEIVSIYSTKMSDVKQSVSISRNEVSKNIRDSNIMIDAYWGWDWGWGLVKIIELPSSMPSTHTLKMFWCWVLFLSGVLRREGGTSKRFMTFYLHYNFELDCK